MHSRFKSFTVYSSINSSSPNMTVNCAVSLRSKVQKSERQAMLICAFLHFMLLWYGCVSYLEEPACCVYAPLWRPDWGPLRPWCPETSWPTCSRNQPAFPLPITTHIHISFYLIPFFLKKNIYLQLVSVELKLELSETDTNAGMNPLGLFYFWSTWFQLEVTTPVKRNKAVRTADIGFVIPTWFYHISLKVWNI